MLFLFTGCGGQEGSLLQGLAMGTKAYCLVSFFPRRAVVRTFKAYCLGTPSCTKAAKTQAGCKGTAQKAKKGRGILQKEDAAKPGMHVRICSFSGVGEGGGGLGEARGVGEWGFGALTVL